MPISLTLAGISTLSVSQAQSQRFPIFSVPAGTTTSFCLPCPGALPSAEGRLQRDRGRDVGEIRPAVLFCADRPEILAAIERQLSNSP